MSCSSLRQVSLWAVWKKGKQEQPLVTLASLLLASPLHDCQDQLENCKMLPLALLFAAQGKPMVSPSTFTSSWLAQTLMMDAMLALGNIIVIST